MAKTLFGLAFSSAAADALDRIATGKLRAQLAKKAKSLVCNPYPPGCKKLKGMKDGYEAVAAFIHRHK